MTNMSVKVIFSFMFEGEATKVLNMSLLNEEYDHEAYHKEALPVLVYKNICFKATSAVL